MSRWQPVPVVGGAYTDDCRPWASQDCVNRIPVMAEREGTRSPAMLRDAPGCAVFSILGTDAPVRGMHNAEGKLFVVSAQTLYLISVTGAATSLGTIPGVGRVSMAHNQIAGGNELAIANGLSGYVYNTVTGVLAQISDEGFPGAKVFDFCDGYMMFVEKGGRYWGHSDLAAATDYNTLDRSEAEAQPDKIVTAAVSHREWVVFGERSTEFYRNEGGTTGTFQRINGTEAEIGAAGTHTVAKLDNTLFVIGHDGIGYRLNGYQFVRITTHAIEQAWARCDMSQAYCYPFDDRGHKVWYVTSTDGQTFGYDVATGEWHRRKSYGLDFWRMADLVRWNGVWIGGDYSNGQLYQLDWRLSNDAGEPLERSRTFAVMHDSQNRVHLNALELVYDTGMTAESPPLPQLIVGALTITGDMGDGDLGAAESGTYTVTGGVLPYGDITVQSGTFAQGITLAADGSWSGTRTNVGVDSWVVQVTDAEGTTAILADTSETLSTLVSEILADAPILYWKLNETSGSVVTDYSGYDRHGTITGTPTQSANGLTLTDLDDGAIGPIDNALLVSNDNTWAIEAVVRRDSTGGAAIENVACAWTNVNSGFSSPQLAFTTAAQGGAGKAQAGFAGSGVAANVRSPDVADTGVDVHYMAVRRASGDGLIKLYLYENGVEIDALVAGVAESVVTTGTTTQAFHVGASTTYFPNSYGLRGRVQHVAWYDTEVSAARVLVHAQAGGFA